MSRPGEQYLLSVMSGQRRGLGSSLVRGALACAEPAYAAVMRLRNRLYDTGRKPSHALGRPVISVGNITTGGTGKTPVVRWLAEQLRDRGLRPAILMRGYRGYTVGDVTVSDEQVLLDRALNADDAHPRVPVHADPDRVAGARRVLSDRPDVDVFLLDDGFQHRRVRREVDLVLINATEPFGFGHVLPRGLLREPLGALSRADAFVLTRRDQASPDQLARIEQALRRRNPDASVYHAAHELTGLRSTTAAGPDLPIASLRGRRFFAFSGIGNPQSLEAQLTAAGGVCAGRLWFGDHHAYTARDVEEVRRQARTVGAEMILTTEKDWVKVEPLPGARNDDPPIRRIDMRITFREGDEDRLLAEALAAVGASAPPAHSAAGGQSG